MTYPDEFNAHVIAWHDQVNAYVNYRIKRDQELGWQANYRDEMDMSPDGRRLIDERIWK